MEKTTKPEFTAFFGRLHVILKAAIKLYEELPRGAPLAYAEWNWHSRVVNLIQDNYESRLPAVRKDSDQGTDLVSVL